MNFSQRLKFYSFGIFFGLFLVYVIFGNRGFSCSYFPNARVLDECFNKPKIYTAQASFDLKKYGLDKKFIQNKVFVDSKINFNKSLPREKPCGIYTTYYPKKKSIYSIEFKKCKDKVLITAINKL